LFRASAETLLEVARDPNTVWLACRQAAQRAGITKRLTDAGLADRAGPVFAD